MNLIAIIPEHLWLIESLNDGVVPEIEEGEVNYFLYDPESGNEILTADEVRARFSDGEEYVARFTK